MFFIPNLLQVYEQNSQTEKDTAKTVWLNFRAKSVPIWCEMKPKFLQNSSPILSEYTGTSRNLHPKLYMNLCKVERKLHIFYTVLYINLCKIQTTSTVNLSKNLLCSHFQLIYIVVIQVQLAEAHDLSEYTITG